MAYLPITQTRFTDPEQARIGLDVWRPFSRTASPENQIGTRGAVIPSIQPGKWDGIQRYNGVSGLRSHYNQPSSSTGHPSWQQSQYPSAALQAQRFGQSYTGGLGPVNSQVLSQRVLAAQVRQSGLGAVRLGAALNPYNLSA